jgi:hypothetical protein
MKAFLAMMSTELLAPSVSTSSSRTAGVDKVGESKTVSNPTTEPRSPYFSSDTTADKLYKITDLGFMIL